MKSLSEIDFHIDPLTILALLENNDCSSTCGEFSNDLNNDDNNDISQRLESRSIVDNSKNILYKSSIESKNNNDEEEESQSFLPIKIDYESLV